MVGGETGQVPIVVPSLQRVGGGGGGGGGRREEGEGGRGEGKEEEGEGREELMQMMSG